MFGIPFMLLFGRKSEILKDDGPTHGSMHNRASVEVKKIKYNTLMGYDLIFQIIAVRG